VKCGDERAAYYQVPRACLTRAIQLEEISYLFLHCAVNVIVDLLPLGDNHHDCRNDSSSV
jgi:hypothetical protein